jgi:hypothetical protein
LSRQDPCGKGAGLPDAGGDHSENQRIRSRFSIALGDAGPKTRVHVRLIVVVSATNSIDSAEETQTKGMMTFSRVERVRG